MKRLVTAIFLLAAAPAVAQDADIQSVIEGQMRAFQAEDSAAAFEFASPMIKGMFGSPRTFGMMVRRGYPMVWNNAETRFLQLREIDGEFWQKIRIRDEAGGLHLMDYRMVETQNGWQIDGVVELPAPDVGV
ncbi:DUF4864 domain-containing protein [Salibaculum sp.]|uniref:DUF4864 domain-containing protein n=1 Tax=Salibaculum sp. TaxID=2855480 RepID=UPI002B4784FE|nr:DUF4864 domain-containing protein [Salibaculum sp.]HKL69175.1 DUF4864 domain-containing protein [Salibaculum sp.]